MNSLLVVVVALALGALRAFHPKLRSSRAWRATVTPLASIMGSGFLVSAPLLVALVGRAAPLAMAGLLGVAWLVGAVVRFNILHAEPLIEQEAERSEHRQFEGHHQNAAWTWRRAEKSTALRVEQLSHLVLAGAYTVSVSYYLQLFGAFTLQAAGMRSELAARVMTTVILVAIAGLGWWRGLKALEGMERYAVALNLGTIGALLVGLAVYDGNIALHGGTLLPDLPAESDPVHVARSLMGLLIVVQGFETSRFLGAEHSPKERVSTMRAAQLIASAIYLVFSTLARALFTSAGPVGADVTAIINLVGPVAVVLPVLVTIAAGGSQVSAAVADDAGCAGLAQGVLAGRQSGRSAYLLIGATTVALTWLTDVLQVISVASRAFTLYYALQCAVAAATAAQDPKIRHRGLVIAGATLLGLLCLVITILGLPAE